MTNPFPNSSWYLKYHHNEAWGFIDKLFTAEECQRIKELASALSVSQATVGSVGQDQKLTPDIRKNSLSWMNSNDPDVAWIYQRLTDAVNIVNTQFWNYDLDYIEVLQYTIYDQPQDHYQAHIDLMFHGLHQRKLSFSLQLDAEDDYAGCDLEISNGGQQWIQTKRAQGTFIAFPSWLMHRVTDLTSGSRHCLVGWVCGPKFR